MKDNPILPHRALYICDETCTETCDGCYLVRNGLKFTTSVVHAKNGPVVNVREWETRFKVEQIGALVYYVEIEN